MVSRTPKAAENLGLRLKRPALKKWILQSLKPQKHFTVYKAYPLYQESVQYPHSSFPGLLLPHTCFIPLVGRCRGPPASFTDEEWGPGILSDACRAVQLGAGGAGTQLPPPFLLWSPFPSHYLPFANRL